MASGAVTASAAPTPGDVPNRSLSTDQEYSSSDQFVRDSLAVMALNGIAIVAAAGNDPNSCADFDEEAAADVPVTSAGADFDEEAAADMPVTSVGSCVSIFAPTPPQER